LNRLIEKKVIKRYRIDVTGTVQGVGFRPFIYRLARLYCLTGFVRNTPVGVEIEVEGPQEHLETFEKLLDKDLPPASRITDLSRSELEPLGDSIFTIEESDNEGGKEVVIPPDIATCEDCTSELLDPSDRRYKYPFINCTNCGPRHTIVKQIPYDRDRTTMTPFTMCDACMKEYHDPMNRRFHAQPNACWECGPMLTLLDASGKELETDDPITEVTKLLERGYIIAVKGIGGFHLATDATRGEAVRRLRERKRREEKPFAVMSGDLRSVHNYVRVGPAEEKVLLHPARPILLLEKKDDCPIAEEVAPSNRYLGVMLPYTPLHLLLFEGHDVRTPLALVMTSANLGEEPIVKDNQEAIQRLGDIADYYLVHNRDIHQRADDSVVRSIEGGPYTIRRSRGYVPSPIRLRTEVAEILGCGAHLKNTVCIAKGRNAYLSQHIGDLENELASEFYEEAIDHLERILEIHPDIIAHDLHPDYLSTRYAEERGGGGKRIAVQHHHAHIASCLAENGVSGPVIGISCDGTGLGDDGTIWGGEILLADLGGYERIGHFDTFPLPGGDGAIREPWRAAYSVLRQAFPIEYRSVFPRFFPEIAEEKSELIEGMLEKGINSPSTSSLGRLFDAVSAILGVCRKTSYEGQAAIGLEMAMQGDGMEGYGPDLREEGERVVIGTGELVRRIVDDLGSGLSAGQISLKFHNYVVNSLCEAICILSAREGIRDVALSGGCFQNVFLLERLDEKLKLEGFNVLKHADVPANDGGISLGQIIVADFIVKTGKGE
jgi:hydrogenase maturation protein HypF